MKQLVDIYGFEGVYKINEIGEVISFDKWARTANGGIRFVPGRKMKLYSDNDGYKIINLCNDGYRISAKVHRLVALTFISNPDHKPYVNHINGIKWDNRVENLEWSTEKENSAHAAKAGLYKQPFLSKLVVNLDNGIFYNSCREAAESKNIPLPTLKNKLNGYRKNNTSFIYI